MARGEKLLRKVREGRRPSFAELCAVVEYAGYVLVRQEGSHLHYRHESRPGLCLQKSGAEAKVYQVKQVLKALEGL